VSNGAWRKLFSGGPLDSESQDRLAAGARGDLRGEQGNFALVVVESVGNPLGRRQPTGRKVFDDCGMRVCEVFASASLQAQKVYEAAAGRYTPEGMPENHCPGFYEGMRAMPWPYMWAAILIYALWPSY